MFLLAFSFPAGHRQRNKKRNPSLMRLVGCVRFALKVTRRTMESGETRQPSPNVPENTPAPGPKVIDSRELFRDRQEIQIRHQGELYRLRLTRNGRLILNK